ncbi:sigma-70 family RNA polymerase sigma factor [Bacillus sp. JJ1503]|uniref:sigma-70 family RNA polymerase sigma factor n=1 Tax=Bacillus sp. JJ1503 TaxID=3122956 RepID=UPI002FFDCCDD
MNESRKLQINEMIAKYILTKSEIDFERVYRNLLSEYQPKLNYWASTTAFLAGKHEAQELFDETFMRVVDSIEADGGDFVKLFNFSLHNRFKSLLRKLQVKRKYEDYGLDSDNEKTAIFEFVDDFNLEEHITAKKKADQRQLIDFLLNGADETTTAIVEAFLSHPKPTATAIAKELGFHHSKVLRALTRLAAKYDTKQFGSHRDYLVAL